MVEAYVGSIRSHKVLELGRGDENLEPHKTVSGPLSSKDHTTYHDETTSLPGTVYQHCSVCCFHSLGHPASWTSEVERLHLCRPGLRRRSKNIPKIGIGPDNYKSYRSVVAGCVIWNRACRYTGVDCWGINYELLPTNAWRCMRNTYLLKVILTVPFYTPSRLLPIVVANLGVSNYADHERPIQTRIREMF